MIGGGPTSGRSAIIKMKKLWSLWHFFYITTLPGTHYGTATELHSNKETICQDSGPRSWAPTDEEEKTAYPSDGFENAFNQFKNRTWSPSNKNAQYHFFFFCFVALAYMYLKAGAVVPVWLFQYFLLYFYILFVLVFY